MDQRTRKIKAVKPRREWFDLIVVGLIMFVAGFCVGVAYVLVISPRHH